MTMAPRMFISICKSVFFIFNFYIHVSAENINDNTDWKLALQKIDDLQKIVRAQDERISMLEKRPTWSQIQTVTELQNTVKKQDYQIAQLEARIQELDTVVKAEDGNPVKILGDGPLSGTNETSVMLDNTYRRRGTFNIFNLNVLNLDRNS